MFLFSKTYRPHLVLTQHPMTLVPPNSAVVTNEWSCTTTSRHALMNGKWKNLLFEHFIYIYTLHIISHLSVFGTLSLLCYHPLLHLQHHASCHPSLKREVTNIFRKADIHLQSQGSQLPPKITLHIHLSESIKGIKHKEWQFPIQQRMQSVSYWIGQTGDTGRCLTRFHTKCRKNTKQRHNELKSYVNADQTQNRHVVWMPTATKHMDTEQRD